MLSKVKELSSNELLSLVILGNQTAFTEIYNRYWRMLFAIAYNRIKDLEDAEDIVHDVLASLWNNRNTTEILNLKVYLATAVKFRVLATIRKQQSQYKFNEQISDAERLDTYDVVESMHNRLIIQAVNNEIENLPQKCKLVFKCSREQNMSIKQISEHLNLSSSTVENHLNRALKQLRVVAKNLRTNMLTFFL